MTPRRPTDWLIAKRSTVSGPDGLPIDHHVFWTGGRAGWGTSVMSDDAYRFSTYAAALECCGTHDILRDSDEWRIIPAVARRSLQRTGSGI